MTTHEGIRHHDAPPPIPDTVDPALRSQWDDLTAATPAPPAFDPGMLTGLPQPVRRWLTHAIAPGTPLRRSAVLHQQGQIKLGRWWRYRADWALAPLSGFIWAARTSLGPVTIRGFDRYTRSTGEMRWDLFGLVPFMRATGPDVTRSALGRLAAELCFVPAAALAAELVWSPVDDHRATAAVTVDGSTSRLTITVADTGTLTRVDVPRWGQPGGTAFGEHLFTAVLDGPERDFDGYTIPVTGRAGWWHCPDGCASEEFIRFSIDQAHYR
ncbi:hypothetical protein F4553_007716 [Allocatelliglobosispora scoriae]|uniref:Uncharacterized protein n=1 Tax=Allocatelliglobosispora scoriae TaxID=643052 RepID=A0A841C5D3_9ACTN|nr:DUF6544 family protein [Allocatelliglobosispora scoriae]MBB5874282.1 hypothetical protein [Allocatelliglobosispora scoriae]